MTANQKIINAAKTLFFSSGMKKVSIVDICEKAGVSKMTFYRNFKNKEDIVYSILLQLHEKGIKEYKSIMSSKISFPEKMEEVLKMKHRYTQEMSMEFFSEVYQEGGELLQKFHQMGQENMQIFMSDLDKAKEEGLIRKDLNNEFISYIINNTLNIVQDPNFSRMYNSVEDMVRDLNNFYFYGILGHKDK